MKKALYLILVFTIFTILYKIQVIPPTNNYQHCTEAINESCQHYKTPPAAEAIAEIKPSMFQNIATQQIHSTVEIFIEENKQLLFCLENIWKNENYHAVQGTINYPHQGFLYLKNNFESNNVSGTIHFYDQDFAYTIENNKIYKRNVNDVICHRYTQALSAAIPQEDQPDDFFPNHNSSIASLQSLPGANNVIFIDFRGKKAPHEGWPNIDALPFENRSHQSIKETWSIVAEAFAPYNINVTTDHAIFDLAPENQRMQCIITKSKEIHPNTGGVAILNSWGSNRVCWVFLQPGRSAGMAVAHEIGHTLTLRHHGTLANGQNEFEEYYNGHGNNLTKWAPIMGTSYNAKLAHWTNGFYPNANNKNQYDLDKIIEHQNILGTFNRGINFKEDDHGNSILTATTLNIQNDGTTFTSGVITNSNDLDLFSFSLLNDATIDLNIRHTKDVGALDICAKLYDANNSIIATYDDEDSVEVNINKLLPAGTYFISVEGGSRSARENDPGYPNYGSVGFYRISGTIPNALPSNFFRIEENSPLGFEIGSLYSTLENITSFHVDNPAITINHNNLISIADPTFFNYEKFTSSYYHTPIIKFNVTAQNLHTSITIPIYIELIDINEPPSLHSNKTTTSIPISCKPSNAPIYNFTYFDEDIYDNASFSIAGADSEFFYINPKTGQLSVKNILDENRSTMQISVIVTDKNSLSDQIDFSINLLNSEDIKKFPTGSISANVFNNLINSPLYDFSSNKSHDQSFLLPSFSHQLNKDNYGEIISGYLIPPTSANYTFYIAADEQAELLISTDSSRINLYKIAECPKPVKKQDWNQFPKQKSASIKLQANKAYFIEARLKENSGSDHIAVAWQSDTMPLDVISSVYLSPIPAHFSQSLVAHWPFNEVSNNITIDASGNNYHADVQSPKLIEGINSYALQLDANTQISLPVEPFNKNIDEYTISFYADNKASTSSQILYKTYYNDESSDGSFILPTDSYKNIFLQTQQSFILKNCENYKNFQNWHFWTITKNAALNQLAIYCDGLLIHKDSPKKNFINNPITSFEIGKKNFNYGGIFLGAIDDFKLFSKALSESEILQLYQESKNPSIEFRQSNQSVTASTKDVVLGCAIINLPTASTLSEINAKCIAGWNKISNLRIFYTAANSAFSNDQQIGFFNSSNNVSIESINLPKGDNFFWFVTDIDNNAESATIIDISLQNFIINNQQIIPHSQNPPQFTSIIADNKNNALHINNNIIKFPISNAYTNFDYTFRDYKYYTLGAGDQAMAITSWIKYISSGTLFSLKKGDAERSGYHARINDQGKIIIRFNQFCPELISKQKINDNQFHHIAMVLNENKLLLYIDGFLDSYVSSDEFTKGVYIQSTSFTIGADQYNSDHLNAMIKDFRIYRTTNETFITSFSQNQIRSIMTDVLGTYNPDSTKLDFQARLYFDNLLNNSARTEYGFLKDAYLDQGNLTFIDNVFFHPQTITPTNLKVLSTTNSTINISFDHDNLFKADSFELALSTTKDFSIPLKSYSFKNNAFTLTNLNAGTSYYLKVRAIKNSIPTNWSTSIAAITSGQINNIIAPTTHNQIVEIPNDNFYSFTLENFPFFSTIPLVAIKINSLPTNGELTLDGKSLKINNTILSNQIKKLRYMPNDSFSIDSFLFTLTDGYSWSNQALFSLKTATHQIENNTTAYFQDNICYWHLKSEANIKEFQIINLLTNEVISSITANGSLQYNFPIPENLSIKLQIIYTDNSSQYITIDNKVTYQLLPQWNLIAIAGSTSSKINLPIWTWQQNNSTYQKTSTPPSNQGFWVFSENYTSLIISLLPNNNNIEIERGWNLISNKFTLPNNHDGLFFWNAQLQIYEYTTEMLPNTGYWYFHLP